MTEEMKARLAAVNMENIQKYILGTKGNGQPRAVYDIIRDYTIPKKKKKKNKGDGYRGSPSSYAIYMTAAEERKRKKKKKKKKKQEHFHI